MDLVRRNLLSDRENTKESKMMANDNYTLPKSSKKGQPFIDWNEVLKESIGITDKEPLKTVKKKRKKENGSR